MTNDNQSSGAGGNPDGSVSIGENTFTPDTLEEFLEEGGGGPDPEGGSGTAAVDYRPESYTGKVYGSV